MQFLGLTKPEADVLFSIHCEKLRRALGQNVETTGEEFGRFKLIPTPEICQDWTWQALSICDGSNSSSSGDATGQSIECEVPKKFWSPTCQVMEKIIQPSVFQECEVTRRYVEVLLHECILSHRDIAAITVFVSLQNWMRTRSKSLQPSVNYYRTDLLKNSFTDETAKILLISPEESGTQVTAREASQVMNEIRALSAEMQRWTWVVMSCCPKFEQDLWTIMVRNTCCNVPSDTKECGSSQSSLEAVLGASKYSCETSRLLAWLMCPDEIKIDSPAREPLLQWIHNAVLTSKNVARGSADTNTICFMPLKEIGDGYWWLRVVELCILERTREFPAERLKKNDQVITDLAAFYAQYLVMLRNGVAHLINFVTCRLKYLGKGGAALVQALREYVLDASATSNDHYQKQVLESFRHVLTDCESRNGKE